MPMTGRPGARPRPGSKPKAVRPQVSTRQLTPEGEAGVHLVRALESELRHSWWQGLETRHIMAHERGREGLCEIL